MAAEFPQTSRGHKAHLGEEVDDHGHLENQAGSQRDAGHCFEVAHQGDPRLHIADLIVAEELQAQGGDHEIAEADPQEEQEAGSPGHPSDGFGLIAMQARLDEAPHLAEGEGKGHDEAADGGHQDVRGEVAEHGGVDQLVADVRDAEAVAGPGEMSECAPGAEGDEVRIARGEDEPIEHPILGHKEDDRGRQDAQQGEEQASPQFLEVVHEPHFLWLCFGIGHGGVSGGPRPSVGEGERSPGNVLPHRGRRFGTCAWIRGAPGRWPRTLRGASSADWIAGGRRR